MSDKKIYSISMPVYSQVVVYVEAENDAVAEEIASYCACMSDAEPIDFANEQPDIIEIGESDVPSGERIYSSRNNYRVRRK
jgi:hypothetical protein